MPEIEMLPEVPASMPSPIPLRPPAVQDSPSAPPGKEMKVEETSEAVVQDEPSKSSSSTPPAAAATDTDSSSDDDDLLEYANIEHTRKNDVLCGRGVTTNRHPGNEKFRALVHANKELYVSSSKRDKMAISRSIVEAVRARKPSGRFLEKDVDRNLWFDIGDKKAIEKTSQALRDGAAAYRKQMSDDMSDPNFLDAVFDEDGEGNQSKRESEHRRTNSDPGHRRTSSGSTKRKSPSGEEKEWLKVVPSDEKEQKEALERMTKSPAGAASVPFRPDRRPVRREHKRGLSVGSLTLSRMYSRDTPRGMPYPRQTPPTSPRGDPYHHSSHSPYGYGHSPYPYHCPPTPTSPGMMRYSRSYSWDNEHHHPPPSPYHHHHHTHHHFHHNHSRPPPPPRSSSDPGSPDRHHPYGPPSPVSHGRKGAPPPSPGSPRKAPSGYHHPPHEGWGSPRAYGHAHSHGPGGPPMSPRPGHQYSHSPYQHPPPYHQQYYNDQHYRPHHHHPDHRSPPRPGLPPLSPRPSDVACVDEVQDMVVDERPEPEPPTLSIPTLSQDSPQDQEATEGDQKPKSSGEKVKRDDDRPPPPKWYPTPQRAPRSPARYGKGSYHDSGGHQDDNPFAPPPSRLLRHEKARPEKELLSSPLNSPSQERERQEEKLPVSARSLLLPERLRGETALPPRNSAAVQPQEVSPARHSRKNAMSSLEVSPEASFDDGDEDPGQCPPEEIRNSFTFINGQLLQNDTPVNITSSIAASTSVTDIAMNPSLPLSNPFTSPDTPKAVTAVEKFPVEFSGEPGLGKGLRAEADIEIDNADPNVNVDVHASVLEERAGDPAASPLPEFNPTKDDDSMLIMDDERGLSPLPFDGSGEMNDEPLMDLSEFFFP